MNKWKTIRIFLRNSGLFRDKSVNLCYNAIVHNERHLRRILRKTNIFLKYVFWWSVAAFFILLLVTMYNLPEILDPDKGRRSVVHRRFRALTRFYTAAAVEFSALCCAKSAIGLRRKEKEWATVNFVKSLKSVCTRWRRSQICCASAAPLHTSWWKKRSSQSSGQVDGSGCPELPSMHGWTAGEPDNRVKELYIWRRS